MIPSKEELSADSIPRPPSSFHRAIRCCSRTSWATVDVISGLRLLPAGGLGIDLPSEIEAMGFPRQERAARLAESITLIKALWSGEPTSISGRFWSVTELQLTPRPTRPKLEFWLGGRAPAALRRIGQLADGWLASSVSPDELPSMIATIRAAAAEACRTIDQDYYGATVFAVPGEDDLSREASSRLRLRRCLGAMTIWPSAPANCASSCSGSARAAPASSC